MGNQGEIEEFVVSARKFRPLLFKNVVGQEHISTTLKNAIASGRIHHAYLFSGPRGVGKTTMARIYARAVNCENPGSEGEAEPCNQCPSCTAILEGKSIDVIEIDGASNNSVDDIRKLRETAKYPPSGGKYKIYIVDEVHMLSTSAFNALLKTLEEPPSHLLFVFATTEPHKVPATILSRCQRFGFRRMELKAILGQLRQIAAAYNIEIEEEALLAIAKKADGSMRDAESIFDQASAFCGGKISFSSVAEALHIIDRDLFIRIANAVKNKDVSIIFRISEEISCSGYDLQECLRGLLEHFRNILTVKVLGNTNLVEAAGDYSEICTESAAYFSKGDLLRYLNLISAAEQSIKFSAQPRIRFEMVLVQLASMDSAIEISQLIEEIKSLKSQNPVLPKQQNPPQQQTYRPATEKQAAYSNNSIPKNLPSDLAGNSIKSSEIKEPAASESIHSENLMRTNEPQNEYTITSPGTITSDASGISENWRLFLGKYANSETGLQILNQQNIITPKFFNGEIILRADNDFALDNITRRKQKLVDCLKEFFGEKISVKILNNSLPEDDVNLNTDSPLTKMEIKVETAPVNKENHSNSSSSQNNENLNPVEKTIVELFGAKEIKGND